MGEEETRAFRAALLFSLERLAFVVWNSSEHGKAHNSTAARSHSYEIEAVRERYLDTVERIRAEEGKKES